jgi:hypothetical protein
VKPVSNAVACAFLLPKLMEAGRDLGYAICAHGSLARDLDVVAVPWTETAESAERLIIHLAAAVGGVFRNAGRRVTKEDGTEEWETVHASTPTVKPHGRLAWTIHVGDHGLYIDVSVMPRVGLG